jgi:hypothetical protein
MQRQGFIHILLDEHESEGLEVEGAKRRDGRALVLRLREADGAGTGDT